VPGGEQWRSCVESLQRMLAVTERAHRFDDLFGERLELEGGEPGPVLDFGGRVVVHEAGTRHATRSVDGLEELGNRLTTWCLRELISVDPQPPNVLVALRLGDVVDDSVHDPVLHGLVVARSRKDELDHRSGAGGDFHGPVLASVVHQVHALTTLGEGVGNRGLDDVFLHPRAHDGEEPEPRERFGYPVYRLHPWWGWCAETDSSGNVADSPANSQVLEPALKVVSVCQPPVDGSPMLPLCDRTARS